jgi:hypothetical protein
LSANPEVAVATLTSSDPEQFDRFGSAVNFRGSRIVVGAPYHDVNVADDGEVYVFETGE